jgi:hypothetical protein
MAATMLMAAAKARMITRPCLNDGPINWGKKARLVSEEA